MGKKLILQRRGRGTQRFRTPSHRYKGNVEYPLVSRKFEGKIVELLRDAIHTSPLMKIKTDDNKSILLPAPEGVMVGQTIKMTDSEASVGNIMPVGNIPEGYAVYNIELSPGDGGKLVRSAGAYATVISHEGKKTVIQLPSGKFKTLLSSCRATVGIVAGGGRKDKPFVKAGLKYYSLRARGKLYPKVRGVAMNPVAHPHGGGSHQHVGKSYTIRRDMPPGKKVGSISARRTGRRK